ncbi:hypothetical protein HG530_003992 [Fusarium avenaceum]|nr:hypothetical protein HG530_003992 [Fusarium avenaceum]
MQLDIALAPPGVLRSDRDQVSSLHIGVNTQVVRDVNHEEVSVEELLEEVVLVEVDVDELDVGVLRNILAAEQAFKRLDLALGVVICIGLGMVRRWSELELVEEVKENGEELLHVVERVLAVGVAELVQDDGSLVFLAQLGDLAAA